MSFKYRRPEFGDPTPAYRSMESLWSRSRAVLDGEKAAKEHDETLDVSEYKNLLIPFSPKMSQEQYNFYKAEAELPGLVSQYARILVDGILRKEPSLQLPESVKEDASYWIFNAFTSENNTLYSFLQKILWEEISTSGGWISVDFPNVDINALTAEERAVVRPYPVLWRAEQVTNWIVGPHPRTGNPVLNRIQFRFVDFVLNNETAQEEPVHTLADHFLDEYGVYQVKFYTKGSSDDTEYRNGEPVYPRHTQHSGWRHDVERDATPTAYGQKFNFIPVFPVNGSLEYEEPILQPLVTREIALYNKISRRNHLLLGAGTYTPWIASSMSEEEFECVTQAGLGSWLKLNQEDSIGVLEPPTSALADYDRSIEGTLSEMTRMGMRMMSPETAQSGVALEIRNASQTARLGMVNTAVSGTVRKVIDTMLWWQYGELPDKDTLEFTMSSDFNPTPLGADWLRLVTEWYTAKLIPRSSFIHVAKQNDLLPNDYDDEEGYEEIMQDALVPGYETQQNDQELEEDLE